MKGLEEIVEFGSSPELIEKIKEFSIQKTYKSGEIIYREDSYFSSIPMVVKGAVKVLRTQEDGKEILLYYVSSGESCIASLLGAYNGKQSTIKVQVVQDSDILFLPMDKVYLFMKEYPQWIHYLLRLHHIRFEELLDTIHAISFKQLDERLVDLLEKKAKLTDSKTIRTTHEQLATELATSRVVVSRLLKELEQKNRIKMQRNKITLL